MMILHDPAFWTFLGIFFGGAFGLIKTVFVYKQRNIIKKGEVDISSEILRSTNTMMEIQELRKVVDRISPMIEKHDLAIINLEKSISNMAVIYSNMNDMMIELKSYYKGFDTRMNNVSNGAKAVMDRLQQIETEIIEFKSGNVLVRTKK